MIGIVRPQESQVLTVINKVKIKHDIPPILYQHKDGNGWFALTHGSPSYCSPGDCNNGY